MFESDRLASETLGALRRYSIEDRGAVAAVLKRATRIEADLSSGLDQRGTRLVSRIAAVEKHLTLEVVSGRFRDKLYYLFSFDLGSQRYFFSGKASGRSDRARLVVPFPTRLYSVERRSTKRRRPRYRHEAKISSGKARGSAQVLDISEGGLGLQMSFALAENLSEEFSILRGQSESQFARRRHSEAIPEAPGWVRVGVSTSHVPEAVQVVERSVSERELLGDSGFTEESDVPGLRSEVVNFRNQVGQCVVGLLDSNSNVESATGFLVPAAWGQVKESLSALAMTLLATMSSLGRASAVLRYDGTNRAGESYIDPECRSPGREYLRFRFSRGAQDLIAALRYLRSRTGNPVVVVSTSLAAVEARKALSERAKGVAGWVSVVGVADLQSTLRAVTGGIDYERGLAKGIRFGHQEIFGVEADMDLTAADALESGMARVEDSRRDMARISVPISWLHADRDSWIDYAAVRELLACGSRGSRKLIRVPTGHRLSSGPRSMGVLRLAAGEAVSMVVGAPVEGTSPTRELLRAKRSQELERIEAPAIDERQFWKDYLLGRQRVFGMRLLCQTSAYQDFMNAQVEQLGDASSGSIVDLGAGLGSLASGLASRSKRPLRLVEVDIVREALLDLGERRDGRDTCDPCLVVADLELGPGLALPFANEQFDGCVASLLIGYLRAYRPVLCEAFRVLRPGGRIVVSSLHHDSDPAVLYEGGVRDFVTDEARASLTGDDIEAFEPGVRDQLNIGAQLFRLAELGRYRFFSAEELSKALLSAGFTGVATQQALGNPAQAIVATAVRP